MEVFGVPLDIATPTTLLLSLGGLYITASMRGWILPRKTVDLFMKIKDDKYDLLWKLYETEKTRGDVLEGLVHQLKVVGETQIKILNSLPEKAGT